MAVPIPVLALIIICRLSRHSSLRRTGRMIMKVRLRKLQRLLWRYVLILYSLALVMMRPVHDS